MDIIDQIKVINNSIYNDIIVEWQGHSEQKVKVSVKYQLMGRTEWARFVEEYKDSTNQMVSFHRELKGERGLYSFLFTCKNIGNMNKDIASYRLDNVMLGEVIKVSYCKSVEGDLNCLEFINIENNWVIPANYLYVEMEHKMYPIGFDIREGSKITILKAVGPKLRCIKPYEKMYRFIQL